MKALALAGRLVPIAAGAGFSAANIHTLAGIVTGVLTAIYTAFTTIEAGLRVWEKIELKRAQKAKQ